MTTATQAKCACEPCQCSVNPDEAIAKNGQYYCSEACADGHPDGVSCSQSSCGCHG